MQILPIRLQDGQELTAKALKHITGTSPIYVRTHKIVNGEDDVRQLFYKDIYFKFVVLTCKHKSN